MKRAAGDSNNAAGLLWPSEAWQLVMGGSKTVGVSAWRGQVADSRINYTTELKSAPVVIVLQVIKNTKACQA